MEEEEAEEGATRLLAREEEKHVALGLLGVDLEDGLDCVLEVVVERLRAKVPLARERHTEGG